MFFSCFIDTYIHRVEGATKESLGGDPRIVHTPLYEESDCASGRPTLSSEDLAKVFINDDYRYSWVPTDANQILRRCRWLPSALILVSNDNSPLDPIA